MRCASCGFENPKGMSFCGKCGASLTPSCPQCGFVNPADFAFCGKCGSPLASLPAGKSKPRSAQQTEKRAKRRSAKTPASQEPRVAAPEAERRQLTVMFCDLVDSTVLSQQLDPEELREVVRAYQETCTAVIRRYDGHIAQHLGDGLLVYFGYPVAHEDDAQRAGQAGLEIVQAIREQGTEGGRQARRQPLQVRIGIHTGLVVIGEIGSSEKRERLALGETPNLAARIQGQANPNEVMMSAATYRLVEGLFECEDRGQPELKGVATPLTLYRVVKEGEAQSRFQVVARKGLTPLVGRDHEYELLQERWARVKEGVGQVVLLSGEPGIGKSRLVEALKETVEHEGARCLELRCSPYAQNSALAPVIEHVQRALGFEQGDSPEEKFRKLEHALECRGRGAPPLQPEVISLFAALLSLPRPPNVLLLTLSPQKQKEKTYEAVVAWLCAEAQHRAVTYAWEDLHWADPSTLELLTLFLAQVPMTRLLAVFTYRPEFTPPWGSHSYLSQLTLSRLERNQVETMVEKVMGGRILPTEVIQQIVNKTDGVPLFVEEVTKSIIESVGTIESGGKFGQSPLPVGIPVTLQDALMARLDRLGGAKEIAQIGATIGREFNYDLLQVVSSLNEQILQQELKQLVEAELVYQSGVPAQARYLFKHALVQDTAYQSLLKSRRQRLHQQVAQVLVEQFPQTVESQPELVAHHYTEAGLSGQAIPYWEQAGQRAIQRSAHTEAVAHFTKGLELLKTLPETPERTRQELTLQTALSSALVVTKGLGAHEVRKAYDDARELCQRVGETPQVGPVLIGLSAYYLQQEEMGVASELAEQCLALAERQHDSSLVVAACRTLVNTSFWSGNPRLAHEYCERALARYDPHQHLSLALVYGFDPIMSCLGVGAWALWYLGYPDQALKRSQAALTLAREGNHLYTLAFALNTVSWTHCYRREGQAACTLAEEAIALSTAQDFPHWLAMALQRRGDALIELGQWEEGTTQLQQGREAYRATGAVLGVRGHNLAAQARGYGWQGKLEEGLQMITEALAGLNQVRHYEAEMYRLKGELTLAQSRVQSLASNVQKEAEECFHKAIGIARQQQAKSWELRAVLSLSRLWQQQGKKHEAHNLLSDIYNWFTEGFDTKDLQEAKNLLEELETDS